MTPGGYLRGCREAAGLELHDLAVAIDTAPPVSALRRAELLYDIEAGLVPVNLSTAVALASLPRLAVDLRHLAELVDAEAADVRLVSQVALVVVSSADAMGRRLLPADDAPRGTA